jgi:hemerythrin
MKATILWNEKMSVGVRQFDEHHKKIIELIHDLSAGPENGKPRDEMYTIISELTSYVHYHFTAEERMMTVYHYPDAMNHIQEHRFFAGRIENFSNEYATGKENIDHDILEFLREWFVKHIMNSDRIFGIFLNKEGVI